jgi:hypothetical protein
MRLRIIGLFCLMAANAQALVAQNKKPCTRDDAIHAETEASSLKDWNEVFRSYKSFAQCDDAAIAEGYSDSVARLLSEHWDSIGQFLRFVSQDQSFEQFVLRHVDELMSPAQLKKIRNNAHSRCPPNGKQFCRAVISLLNAATPKSSP